MARTVSRELLEVGHRVFGENRVQEAEGKFPELKASHPDLELHLIGPLQTNKARDAVALFDVIQSVDRDRLAAALVKEMERLGAPARLLHPGQHRRGTAEGRYPAEGRRCLRGALPRTSTSCRSSA